MSRSAGSSTGRFGAENRLLDSRDYRRVMRTGQRRSGRDLVVFIAPRVAPKVVPRVSARAAPTTEKVSETGHLVVGSALGSESGIAGRSSRLGITASRKVGNAVCRNRFKRRVRAWFRERRTDLGWDVDLIVVARNSGGRLNWAEIDERLSELLEIERFSH